MSSQTPSMTPPLINRDLLTSIIGHVLIILMLTVKAVFFPAEDIIISNAVRVDIVALPDKIQPLEEKPEEPPKEKEKPVEKPKTEPKVEVKKPEAAKFDIQKAKLDQKKALENLKDQLKKNQEAEDAAREAIKEPKSKIYKGNILAPGTEVTGLAKIEYDRYFDLIRTSIKSHLVLPRWLKDANLKAHVLVKLDERGYVILKSVTQSSGNDMYDNLVLTAIAASSPLPPPPERLVNIIQVDGVTLRFPDR